MSGGKSGGTVTGYHYSFTIHMGLCRGPIDALVEIHVGDRRAWPLGFTRTEVIRDYTPTPDGETGWGGSPDSYGGNPFIDGDAD